MKRAPKSAVKLDVFESNDPITAETEAIYSRIRQRAFELSQTRPHDAHQRYDWVLAESETISVPSVEIVEKEGTFEVRFAVSGLNPEDVNVIVTPDQILLKSANSHGHTAGNGTVHFCDFKSTTVFRSVNLPQAIDASTARVSFSDAMIVVSIATGGAEQARSKSLRKAPAKKSQAKTA